MPQLPVILTAFAQSPRHPYLVELAEERTQIQGALQAATDSGAIQLVEQAGSRNEDIPVLLAKYPNQVNIFHFGGHGEAGSLAAEDSAIFIEGLADQLALQSQLKLVFLNACQTQAQVQHFFRQGIPLVLATTCSIADGEASYFAAQFYRAVAGRESIHRAFQLAVGALKARYGQYREVEMPHYKVMRDTGSYQEQLDEMPWQLYVQAGQEEVLNWRLRYPRGLTRLPALQLVTDCLGRENELESLQTLLQESSKVVLVSGLGGMGKTTLAAGYLQWLRNDYDSIAWINSSDDLMSSFALNEDLAKNLELPFVENEKIEDRFARLMNKLRNQPGRNLLVIDDVSNQVSEIAGQLPSGANWQVLMTSRLPLPDFREMKLGVLQPVDALRLFRLHFQEGTDEEVQDLLIEINYHTLTIEVMAKTLNRLNGLLTVPELLDILHERKLDDPRLQELVWTRHAGEERAIFFHLMKAFELAKLSEEEVWLMQQYAVLPAIPIEMKTLADFLQQDPLALNRGVNGLNDKGWIGKLGKGLGMHRMVQEVVKYQREPGVEELSQLLETMTTKMSQEEFENPVTKNFPWLTYAEGVAANFNGLKYLPEKVSLLWNNLALVLRSFGNYSRAAQLLEAVLASDIHHFSETHHIVAVRYSNLAGVIKELGDLKRSKLFFEKALSSNLGHFGPAHPSVATVQSNLATVLKELGEYDHAVELLEKAMEIALIHFGPDHPKVSIYQANLAGVYQNLGQYAKAAALIEKALATDLHNLGTRHPNIAVHQSNLALILIDLGDHVRAVDILEQALEADLNNFGPEHPKVAVQQSNLALALNELGNYGRAAELLESALEADLRNFGPNHPLFAIRQSNLAMTINDLGEHERAIELLGKALDSDLRNFGPDHPTIAINHSNLAGVLCDIGDIERAITLLEKALEADLRHFGPNHPSVAVSQSNLALAFCNVGKYTLAVELMEKALEADLKHLGPQHPTIGIRQSNLATVYFDLQQYDKAIELLQQAMDLTEKTLGKEHFNYHQYARNREVVLAAVSKKHT